MLPACAEERRPPRRVERPECQPPRDRNRIGALEERPQRVDAHGEAEVPGDERLDRHHADHTSLRIDHGAAAVARLDRHRQLDHLAPLHVPGARDDAADDTEGEAERIPDRHDRQPVRQVGRAAEGQRHEGPRGRLDPQDRQVERAIRGGHLDHPMTRSVRERDLERPALAGDVKVRRDESRGIDHEARAESLSSAVPPLVRHHHDRPAHLLREVRHAGRVRRPRHHPARGLGGGWIGS